MRVVLFTTFAASKKETLAAMLDRVHQAFIDSGLPEPSIRFNFADAPLDGFVSSINRVLKRFPELERFVTNAPPLPGIPGSRRISNGPLSEASGVSLPYSTLQTIAAGVPRSFPFHGVAIHFVAPEFGGFELPGIKTAEMLPGILLSDSWWVNGRNRSLSACTVVEGDPSSKKLPPVPEAVAKIFAACGKVKRTIQAPIPGQTLPTQGLTQGVPSASFDPKAALAVQPIVADFRARMQEIVDQAALPNDLPPIAEALRTLLGSATGPKKPVLERAFKPMGYNCRSESGTFTLQRRTAANLTAQLYLDVGTWSRSVTAIFKVWGMGFKATLLLPVTKQAAPGAQYPNGDSENWQKIVNNLAALVAELDRSFVPRIEAAAGPSPEWYQPES